MSTSGTSKTQPYNAWQTHQQNARPKKPYVLDGMDRERIINILVTILKSSTNSKTSMPAAVRFTLASPVMTQCECSYDAAVRMTKALTFPHFNKSKKLPPDRKSKDVSRKEQNAESKPVLSPDRIHARALSCPDVRALYDEACRDGGWTILFEEPISGPRAQTLFDLRTILIDPNLSESEALSSLIFELTNATKAKVALKLDELARHNRIGREEYVKQIERAQHAGALTHHAIVSKAVKELGWHPDVDRYAGVNPDFEAYWQRIAQSEHAERYRLQWDSLQPAAAAAAASLV